jgi:hypothetical protein
MMLVSTCDLQGTLLARTILFVWAVYNYIYACTVKLYNTLNAQNALVKSMYCVREYTLCNLISLYNIHRLHLLTEHTMLSLL